MLSRMQVKKFLSGLWGRYGFSAQRGAPARHWTRVNEKFIQCNVCHRQCLLREGQQGKCFVRENHCSQLVLSTYGRASSICIDPIEKKPLNHFFPGSAILSIGTIGCNMSCTFCQNWHISKCKDLAQLQYRISPREIAELGRENGCRSVAFTYNEPIIFLEYAVDAAQESRSLGLKTVAVTAGNILGKAREEFFAHMDATNIDLKAFTETFYRDQCNAHLTTILDTLVYVARHTKTWLEVTTLLIPGLNDSPSEI